MIQLTFASIDSEPNTNSTEIVLSEQPEQRFHVFGIAALSDTELIAIVIQGGGTSTQTAMVVASHLIAEAGSIRGLATWHTTDFRRVRGVGRFKGLQLSALIEIARRMAAVPASGREMYNRAEVIAARFWPMTIGLQVEKFWVNCLDRRNRLLKCVEISSGSATAALAHPREVFREAVRYGATAVLCVHNHPSGDPAPSAPDLHVTRLLREAARAVDIALLDHLVIGRPEADPTGKGYFSFKEAGLI